MSGVDNHVAGVGVMAESIAPNQKGKPGYEGGLNDRVAHLPALLKEAGYHTYMVGKWHLGKEPDQIPAARGFERDFTMLDGFASYWSDGFILQTPVGFATYTEDGKYLMKRYEGSVGHLRGLNRPDLPKNYYGTRHFTDKMIEFIDSNRGDGKPFFAYVSHQAPHGPYHVPRKWRKRHVADYDKGWDALRQERLARQIEMGIMPEGTELADRLWYVPDPEILAPMTRAHVGKWMELYADLVENMDYHIGRLIDHLKRIGEYDNTLFIFFSDNGAEGANLFNSLLSTQPGTRNYIHAAFNWSQTHHNAWGDPGSFIEYGPAWAQAGATPFALHKAWLSEGGIHTPLIVSGPLVKRKAGSIHDAFLHVADFMPTLLEIVGGEYPREKHGKPLPPMIGKSWVSMLQGETDSPRDDTDWMAWELFGNRAVRQGDWKILAQWVPHGVVRERQTEFRRAKTRGVGDWQLFNLREDPTERHDLAEKHPERLAQMVKLWDEYFAANNIIVSDRSRNEVLDASLPPRRGPGKFPTVFYEPPVIPPPDMIADPEKAGPGIPLAAQKAQKENK